VQIQKKRNENLDAIVCSVHARQNLLDIWLRPVFANFKVPIRQTLRTWILG